MHYDGRSQRCRILLRDLGTGTEKAITQIEGKDTSFINLALTRDGLKLAASIWNDSQKLTRLVVMPPTGGAMAELLQVQGPEPIRSLAWTPDGRQLLFVRRTSAPPGQRRAEVWCTSSEGGRSQGLGLSMREIDRLAVHPDGRRIAFSASDSKSEVWTMENFLPFSGAVQ